MAKILDATVSPSPREKKKNLVKKGWKTFLKECERIVDDIDGTVRKADMDFAPTTREDLVSSEQEVFEDVRQDLFHIQDIEIEKDTNVHTICFPATRRRWWFKRRRLPLVMIHGLGGGLPCFYKNYEHFCRDRKVYGIDLPGFALSSRVTFPKEPEKCLEMMVDLVEKWRRRVRIKKFILLGHSFGGYVSAAYAVEHPSRVRHLVLVDPWGMVSKEDDHKKDTALWEKAARAVSEKLHTNPFTLVREVAPLSLTVVKMFIPSTSKKSYGDKCIVYFHNALTQPNATGESAFSVLSNYKYVWPVKPMKEHLCNLTDSVSITFIYGENSSFSTNSCWQDASKARKNIFFHLIENVEHHVHAEDHETFNRIVLQLLADVNRNRDKCKLMAAESRI